jgi:hypothetical protein
MISRQPQATTWIEGQCWISTTIDDATSNDKNTKKEKTWQAAEFARSFLLDVLDGQTTHMAYSQRCDHDVLTVPDTTPQQWRNSMNESLSEFSWSQQISMQSESASASSTAIGSKYLKGTVVICPNVVGQGSMVRVQSPQTTWSFVKEDLLNAMTPSQMVLSFRWE